MRCRAAALPPGVWEGGQVLDSEAVARALKELLARADIVETRALAVASDALATFRVLRLSRSATDEDVAVLVGRELTLDPERIATQWIDVRRAGLERVVYALAWDRERLKTVTETLKRAGLETTVIDLKSACVARAVSQPSCIVVDLASEPAEILLIDGHVPQVWQAFEFEEDTAEGLVAALAPPLRAVLRFYRTRRDVAFDRGSPVLISAEHSIAAEALGRLSVAIEQPVEALTPPPRVPPDIRYSTYLACLGLIMRRTT